MSVYISDLQVDMELDIGLAISLVSEDTYKKHWPHCQLQQSDVRLKTATGTIFDVSVQYGEQ